MIIVKADSILSATKIAFLALVDGDAANSSDPSIFREDAAVLEVSSAGKDELAITLRDQKLFYDANYLKYFPNVSSDLPMIEGEHYTEILIRSGEIDRVGDALRRSSHTRRALINTWKREFRENPSLSATCITQLYYRFRNEVLEVHSHSRANDCYRLLLMDMQFATWCQREVASRLRVPVGRYIHFVDSLQFYVKHIDSIREQREFLLRAPEWQQEAFSR